MKMKKNTSNLLPAIYGTIPLLLAFICNIGLIFQLPTFFNRESTISYYLYALADITNTRSSVVELAIGIMSGTLIFFAFIQIAYSFKQFPISIVTKYIIYSRKTKSYIGYQIGTVLTLSIFFSLAKCSLY